MLGLVKDALSKVVGRSDIFDDYAMTINVKHKLVDVRGTANWATGSERAKINQRKVSVDASMYPTNK